MSQPHSHARTVWTLLGVVTFMAGMGFASVPLYDLFCRVTGYGGTTARAEAGGAEVLDQTMLIRFDASRAADMRWNFEPPEAPMEIQLGATGMAFYTAHNPTDEVIAGTASYNVTPYAAGPYFAKIDCFCFEQQVLQPGERVEMPVTFYVDPEMLNDPEAQNIPAITLSYTFHVTDLPEDEYAQLQ